MKITSISENKKVFKILSSIGLLGITALSIGLLLPDFIFGATHSEYWWVSLLFIGYWTVYTLKNKAHGFGKITAIWSGLTLLTALLGYCNLLWDLSLDFLFLPVIAFLTPFSGLVTVSSDYCLLYPIMIMFSALWFGMSMYKLKNYNFRKTLK